MSDNFDCSGNGVSNVYEVTLRRARLVLGWVTVHGYVASHSGQLKGKEWKGKKKYLYSAIYTTHSLKALRHGSHTPIACSVVCFPGMTSSLAKVNKSSGAHFRALFLKFPNFLMFLSIQIDLLILKTYDGQFTLTTKKIIAYHL